ncbi:SDR family NAD(P)-dependent oxidoreductase [Nocardia terpenica]|uniref:SDR family NAD(P)-dependent oxidoreductase n=1 Tax=Nocardia terpenica TaxID=455432 RepID=A0A6G9Z7E5_9NOCA|nr:SDR family NAD(P)-dependent oxidoreductase [Nocardia terpenica]QIS21412.1 SDR family NAD(P)-dependent oxidoreductase [Nocardia terpenica]
MKNFTGRTAAITGAGSGIGRALAVRLAAQGCHLALSDINGDGLAATKALLAATGVEITTTIVDVADREQVEKWATDTAAYFEAVHLVFNNAGVAQGGSVTANSYADYEWVLAINLWGVIHGTKAFLPHLIRTGDGHIINISSVFGLQSQPATSAYNTSKFAVRGFTEALRQELDLLHNGVSATCVHPGGIRTEIVHTARVGHGFDELFGQAGHRVLDLFDSMLLTSPDKAAQTILHGIRRDARRILIGADARIIDWEQRLLPTAYQRLNTALITGLGALLARLPQRDRIPADAAADSPARSQDARSASSR